MVEKKKNVLDNYMNIYAYTNFKSFASRKKVRLLDQLDDNTNMQK